ncbi:MAG: hypothetical protein ACRC16_07270, partial [Aeromonas salmonicida]
RLVVLRPVGDGVKRCAHDADLKRMVVIRSPSPQLVPFKLHRFGKQRHGGDQITKSSVSSIQAASIWETTPLVVCRDCGTRFRLLAWFRAREE